MFKLVVLAAVLAVVATKPGLISAPLAYSAPVLAAPVAHAIPAPIAGIAAPVAIPAPVAYSTGAHITVAAEPVEQHGYKIAY